MMSNGKNVIESKCFNKILAHYDGIIEFNNQKNWNSSPGNQWWVIALRFFLKAFSWQNLNPIKKNQKSKCIFIENYTYIYFSLLILCSCKLLKHLEQLDSKALLLNPIVSSLPSWTRGRQIVKKLEYRILRIPANANTKYRIPNRRIPNRQIPNRQILVCITFYKFSKDSALISKYVKYSMMIWNLN